MSHPNASTLRERVLRALALNREPGFHFSGNFVGLSFDELTSTGSRIRLESGAHCEEADGRVNLGAVALLADIALASAVRANLTPTQRLATVSMHLQFTGAPLRGPLEASGTFEGFLDGASGRQGLSRIRIDGGEGKACIGSGTFMALDPPPGVKLHPMRNPRRHAVAPLEEAGLDAGEREILARADRALREASGRHSFIRRLWGFDPVPTKTGATCRVDNGAHIGNRVGHLQGGLQVGLAALTAMASLPASWMLSGISAWFVRAGQGPAFHARSRIVHHGRYTAVVRTEITGKDRRRVLEAVSTHALKRHE